MRREVIIVCLIASMVLVGCHASTSERVFMRLETGERLVVRKAPYDGAYRLYAGMDPKPTTQSARPILDQNLRKGESIGFASDARGAIVAVVGGERAALSGDSRYLWTMQPDPGQIDPARTTILIVAIAVGVGVGIAVAATAYSASGFAFAMAN